MDTINIVLELNQELNSRELEEVEDFIERTGYADVLRINNRANSLNIRLSYPRYFSRTNAYLISSIDECFEVQENFIRTLLKNELTRYSTVRLVRVDIPFTYIMRDSEEFYMYKNIFKIFAEVYKLQNVNCDPKEINDILKGRTETLIYADRTDHKNYYQKIMIYNPYKKFRDKYSRTEFEKICREFPNLSKRIRIEYSIRVSSQRTLGRKMSLEDFGNFNIYGTFLSKAVDYILDNLLNKELIDQVLDDKTFELKEYYYQEIQYKKIDYEKFIYKYSDLILDYKVLRNVLNEIYIRKTREGAVTKTKKLIEIYEAKHGIIILDSYNIIDEIRNLFYTDPFYK